MENFFVSFFQMNICCPVYVSQILLKYLLSKYIYDEYGR